MKLRVFDRILLAILLICAIVVSLVLIGMALNIITEYTATQFVSVFYIFRQNMWILAGSGVVLLLISLKLLFAGRGDSVSQQPATTLIRQSDVGGAFITLEAIDSMAQKHCKAQSRVRECFTSVHPVEDGVSIGIRLSVLPDTDVVQLSEDLQKSLKAYIEGYTGVHVKEIGVLVENMTGTNSTGISTRVE